MGIKLWAVHFTHMIIFNYYKTLLSRYNNSQFRADTKMEKNDITCKAT